MTVLEKTDLSLTLSKVEYKALISDLQERLSALQREAIEKRVPMVILFEGVKGAGKGNMINRLIQTLDPRHFNVHNTTPPNEEQRFRPYLWRFWMQLPASGRTTIFDKSWYRRVLLDRLNHKIKRRELQHCYHEYIDFERQLTTGGYLIIKFFIHISKKQQKRRLRKLENNPSTSWRVCKEDWKQHKSYPKYIEAAEEMLGQTDSAFAPWHIIEGTHWRYAVVRVFETVIHNLESRLADEPAGRASVGNKPQKLPASRARSILDRVDLSKRLSREEYVQIIDPLQSRVMELEHEIYVHRIPVVILYEGWDAAGKGGNIKRLTQKMDPRGYDVIPVAAPNDIERRHHYLWRFWREMPKAGHIAIFDRTWYGRVLVERVEKFASTEEWKRAYSEINEMEDQLVHFGTILLKFWLHIDKEEQLRRFKEREASPAKRWKITEEDWRNRDKWDDYKAALDETFLRTSTTYAPWTIVESNSKYYARIKVLQCFIDAIEARLLR